jgi:hypothetical protein
MLFFPNSIRSKRDLPHKWLTLNKTIFLSIYLAIRQISLLRIHAGSEILVMLATRKAAEDRCPGKTLGCDVGAGNNSCRARVDLAENLLFKGEWNSAI